MSRSHAFLVDHLQVGAIGDEELAHFEAILVNCVVNGPLILGVDHIRIGSKTDQLLDRLYSSLANSIVYWCLPIFVLLIDLIASLGA